MWEKLKAIEARFEELTMLLSQPEVVTNRELFQKYSKEHSDLSELVATYRAYKRASEELEGSKELLNSASDSEMKDMALEEVRMLQGEIGGLEKEIQLLLLPKDPNDEKNVILELRAGTGGDEAALFCAELFRAYLRYCETKNFKVEILGASDGSTGGYKEIIAMVSGKGAFSKLKYERGVHRVQRIPSTESNGRIHTSTITVAVMPEAEDVDVYIDPKDLRIDIYRSSGPGGQSVNTTDSAVRITHIPTGLVVAMQDEKSQHKNKEKGMRVLKSRILDQRQAEADAERSADRKSQVGTGERSEKIRTYNFPQSRVTDHRVGLSLYAITQIMNGELDDLINPVVAFYQAEALRGAI